MESQNQAIAKCQRNVQFTEDTFDIGHDSDIGVIPRNQSLIDIHLGFLQIRHRYEITFEFECCIEGSLIVRNTDSSCPNVNIHVIDLRGLTDTSDINHTCPQPLNTEPIKYKITLQLFAYKEKLLKEEICLHSSQNVSQTLTLVFHARVLGKGKGTPFLKNGIKCIGVEMDEDDDNSDWPGFSN